MRELLPKTPRRAPFQNLNEFGHRHLRWQLDEQMHMIGHRLDLNHHSAKLGDHLSDDLLQPRLDWSTQHITADFGHQITWYFTENTDLRVDRYCMNLTINPANDKHRPLRGPTDGIGYPPTEVNGLRRRKFRSC